MTYEEILSSKYFACLSKRKRKRRWKKMRKGQLQGEEHVCRKSTKSLPFNTVLPDAHMPQSSFVNSFLHSRRRILVLGIRMRGKSRMCQLDLSWKRDRGFLPAISALSTHLTDPAASPL
ncbi:hypothetical protein B0I35DRAFT_277971 [Stachybotrys elegans]|uniref:Uncharacterized protein n=1 Tax=Stachybotrys elegans TaxID=80388 RepID=A0A8K0SNS0_9HYPO|nr:hypothetical protein B0I35DRAFT_277971 [Stachybotrys elegans]